MKTIRELYDEIIASDDLKAAFLEAARSGKSADFLKARGCEATEEEIAAFLKERAGRELTDEELDNAAGGTYNDVTEMEAFASNASAGVVCAVDAINSVLNGRAGQRRNSQGKLCSNG